MSDGIPADAWVVTNLGVPTKAMERQTVEVPAPGPNEARVRRRGVLSQPQRHRHHPLAAISRSRSSRLSSRVLESVGVVESAGEGAEHLVGQRIVAIPGTAHGGYVSYAIVDAATVLTIPAHMSSIDGARSTTPST